ncbi:hypothetical protein [Streptomyces sp. P9-A2]|uniref:hypothetical protein n=1 Tax=Streptomyces sp. P9-A2 TaxID=3072284 RepID=UPI002FC8B0AD
MTAPNPPACTTWAFTRARTAGEALPVLAALCDILDVTPAELIATKAENAAPRRTAASGGADVVDLAATVRPKRARVRPEK